MNVSINVEASDWGWVRLGMVVDGELTIQAAKFNLGEFGSVLSTDNTLRKNIIPRTKEGKKEKETIFHRVQSVQSKPNHTLFPGPAMPQ